MCICAGLRICDVTSAPLDSVAIVGCGLIGASIAAACHHAGINVYCTDVDDSHADVVRSRYGAHPWDGGPVDLIVVAVPPAAVVDAVAEAQVRAPKTPITDVGSVKSTIVAAIESPWFVGGHPLAGAASSGPTGADAGLFAGRPWATCARQRSNAQTRAAVSALITACGAHEVQVAADEHDRAVAVTSHAAQMVASALAVQWAQLPGASRDLRGRAFDEVFRLAGSDPAMWQQIASSNAGAVAHALLTLADQLTEIADGLSSGDDNGVAKLMTEANEAVNDN